MLPHHSKLTKYFFAAFFVVVLLYAYFEARNIIYGPQIVLQSGDGALTVENELIEIRGTVKNVVDITLGGRSVTIDDTGLFVEKLLLAEGVNRFEFEARDKFGNTTSEVLEVVYVPKDQPSPKPQETDSIEEQLP